MSGSNPWIWRAIIAEIGLGRAFESPTKARECGDPDVTIRIVRGSAAPDDKGRLPGTYHSGDIAHEWDVELDHGTDESVSLETRWEQAQAMAAGLNAADDRCSAPPSYSTEDLIAVMRQIATDLAALAGRTLLPAPANGVRP